MNRKLASVSKAIEFFIRKIPRIIQAIEFAKNNIHDYTVIHDDVSRKLRIRDEVVALETAQIVINVTKDNPTANTQELLILIFDSCIQNRSAMSGCCHDCMINVYDIGEYGYMLQHKVWKKAAGKDVDKFLCIPCVETRLNRKLKHKDFNWQIPLTFMDRTRSDILVNRMQNV